MAGNEHFAFVKEDAYGTWVTPTKGLPVRTVSIAPKSPLMVPGETGGGRGAYGGAPGEISVDGDIVTSLFPTVLPWLLRGSWGVRDSAAAGNGFRNKFLFDDDTAHDTFSMQKRYKADVAESIRGSKINSLTIAARAKEFATVTVSTVGKDAVISGGHWSDGSDAPAVIDPWPYPDPMPEGLRFYQGVMSLGGTVALTAGELIVSNGVDRVDMDNIEFGLNFNIGTDAYGVNLGDRTRQSLDEGKREITVKFDANFDTVDTEFYLAWLAGESSVVQLRFIGPEYDEVAHAAYQYVFTCPNVKYSGGAAPELNADYGLKRFTVEGQAFVSTDAAVGVDMGMVIQTSDDLA